MLLGFLEGYDADARGRKLHDIWELSDNQIESTHDFIQWLFPLTEPSQSQPDAPVLDAEEMSLIRASAMASKNMKFSADWYLGFLMRNRHWVSRYDHNHLRITRAIKSLKLLVSSSDADTFRMECIELAGHDFSTVAPNAVRFWKNA